jgi:hypothetical protein
VPLEEFQLGISMTRKNCSTLTGSGTKDSRRLKQLTRTLGIKAGAVVRIPLATPRRLGTLGIISAPGIIYSSQDIGFLQLIAWVVALAIGLNLKRAQSAQACLQHQNERLQLLLNLTNRITSNLDFRELLRAIAANIRKVMRCDAAVVALLEPGSEQYTLYALDFPQSKGFITASGAAKRAVETLKPIVLNDHNPDDMPPEIYDKILAEGLKSRCLIPLVNRGRAL